MDRNTLRFQDLHLAIGVSDTLMAWCVAVEDRVGHVGHHAPRSERIHCPVNHRWEGMGVVEWDFSIDLDVKVLVIWTEGVVTAGLGERSVVDVGRPDNPW
jgi:hypothetical protein